LQNLATSQEDKFDTEFDSNDVEKQNNRLTAVHSLFFKIHRLEAKIV